MNIDYFMQTAIKEAKKAFKNEEVPVGGLIVDNESELGTYSSDPNIYYKEIDRALNEARGKN